MANHNLKKPIIELYKDGKYKAYWSCAKEASEFYNISQVVISYNVNGRTKQSKGHFFRFATNAEIKTYSQISNRINSAESTQASPIEQEFTPPSIPAEIIPDTPQEFIKQENTISPFTRLLQKSKKKFNDNSK